MKKQIVFFLLILQIFICYANVSAQDSWTCINGHEGNTGNFCTECGAPRPTVSESWTCINGHSGNTGKFCSECGAPRPEPDAPWTCENGHEGNTGNFCTECGAPRPVESMPIFKEQADSTPSAVPAIQAKPRNYTIWQNKKLIVEAIPDYMFVQNDSDEPETEKPGKKKDNSHDHYNGEPCTSDGATWWYFNGKWVCANG